MEHHSKQIGNSINTSNWSNYELEQIYIAIYDEYIWS